MGNYKFTILLPFFIVLSSKLGNSQSADLFPDVCSLVNCVQGKCKPSNVTFLPDCDCNPGWKKLQIGDISFPLCIVPDSTSPAPPPPPENNTATCLWCGDGTCVKDGDANICKCNQGSANRYFGADCNNLGFGSGSPPPPWTQNGMSPPPPSSTTFGLNKT
ncbi:hypothetical protein MKX01_022695, partial [Papaver californicum]